MEEFVVGALSLSSAEFIVPLFAGSLGLRLTVMVSPPLQLQPSVTSKHGASLHSHSKYFSAHTPITRTTMPVIDLTFPKSLAGLSEWVDRGEAELVSCGLISAAACWRANGRALLNTLAGDQQDSGLITAADMQARLLSTIYNSLGLAVDVQLLPAAVCVPLSSRAATSPEFQFLSQVGQLLDLSDGGSALRGRGQLILHDGPGSPVAVKRLHFDLKRNTLLLETVSGSDHTLPLGLGADDGSHQPAALLRPCGCLRLVQLASHGIPAHVPWYSDQPVVREVVWSADGIELVRDHGPVMFYSGATTPDLPPAPSGIYLWEYSSDGSNPAGALVSHLLGPIDWRVDPTILTRLSRLYGGRHLLSRRYNHARGVIQNEYPWLVDEASARLRAGTLNLSSIVDALLLTVAVWNRLSQLLKAIVSGEMENILKQAADLRRIISSDLVDKFRSTGYMNAAISNKCIVVEAALNNTVEWLETIASGNSRQWKLCGRYRRGWFELAAATLDTLWNVVTDHLLGELLPLYLLLGHELEGEVDRMIEQRSGCVYTNSKIAVTRR